MAREDDATRLVDVELAHELIETGGRSVQVGIGSSSIKRKNSFVKQSHLPASNSKLSLACEIHFGANVMGNLLVGDLDSAIRSDGSVSGLGDSNERSDSAAVAVLGANDDNSVRGERACNV